jgi:hypothetical protein
MNSTVTAQSNLTAMRPAAVEQGGNTLDEVVAGSGQQFAVLIAPIAVDRETAAAMLGCSVRSISYLDEQGHLVPALIGKKPGVRGSKPTYLVADLHDLARRLPTEPGGEVASPFLTRDDAMTGLPGNQAWAVAPTHPIAGAQFATAVQPIAVERKTAAAVLGMHVSTLAAYDATGLLPVHFVGPAFTKPVYLVADLLDLAYRLQRDPALMAA